MTGYKLRSNVNICTTPCTAILHGWCAFVVGALLCSTSLFARAELPALYGMDYFRLVEGAQAAESTEQVEDVIAAGTDAEYLAQLEREEVTAGPYSDALAEPLAGLGHYYRGRGRYDKALRSFGRALHVVRVNDGLYSERQAPLVRDLLDTYRLAGDLQGLDERYEYFFRLYGNGQPPFTQLRQRASLEFLRWQREAYRLKVGEQGTRRLVDLYHLNQRILDAATAATEVDDDWYGRLVIGQLRNLYLLKSEVELREQVYGFGTASAMAANQERGMLDLQQQRLEALLRSASSRGRSLLEAWIARLEGAAEPRKLAAAQLELGDWKLWNDNSAGAREAYAEVIQILQASGNEGLVQQWFSSPVELPVEGVFWRPDATLLPGRRVLLAANYEVTSRGRARGVDVVASAPEDEAHASKLRRQLSATRFRPRFVSGEAESVTGVNRRYELLLD